MYKKPVIIICFTALVTSCAAPINRKTSEITAQAGYLAQQQGDWDAARNNYAKAVVNAELGNEAPQKVAVLYYEYGRSLGVTCYFDDAEKYLSKALTVDRETNGPAYMSILELARLNYDQNKYQEANNYYYELLSIYEKHNAEGQDPIGVADVYAEFAFSLEAVGKYSESAALKQRAITLKSKNSGKISSTERTPYAKRCRNN